jgi:branched-chain amino acid transport system substrate-binding protein
MRMDRPGRRPGASRWLSRAGGRRPAAGMTALALAAGLAACGSSSDNDTATAGGAATTAAKATSTTASAAAPTTVSKKDQITDYAAYVGGKAGAAASGKAPIVIGYVNQQGGPNDLGPNATQGAQLAVDYINKSLGGIEGHPLKLKTCFTATSESEGQKCAQQMLNDKAVTVVAMGAEALGDASFQRTMNGAKPLVYGVSSNPVDAVSKNTYVLYGDQTQVLLPWATYGRDVLKAKKVTVVYPEVAGLTQAAAVIAKAASDAGLEAKKVGVSPTATDLVGPLTAAGVQSADMVVPMSDPKTCVNIQKALTQMGAKAHAVSPPTCLDPTVAKGLGGDLAQWDYGIATSLVGDPTDASTVPYVKLLAAAGEAKLGPDVWPMMSFGEVLTIAKFMNEIGADKITSDEIGAKLKAFKGPMVMGAPTIACGANAKLPGACSNTTQFFHYAGKGKFARSSGWLGAPTA